MTPADAAGDPTQPIRPKPEQKVQQLVFGVVLTASVRSFHIGFGHFLSLSLLCKYISHSISTALHKRLRPSICLDRSHATTTRSRANFLDELLVDLIDRRALHIILRFAAASLPPLTIFLRAFSPPLTSLVAQAHQAQSTPDTVQLT